MSTGTFLYSSTGTEAAQIAVERSGVEWQTVETTAAHFVDRPYSAQGVKGILEINAHISSPVATLHRRRRVVVFHATGGDGHICCECTMERALDRAGQGGKASVPASCANASLGGDVDPLP